MSSSYPGYGQYSSQGNPQSGMQQQGSSGGDTAQFGNVEQYSSAGGTVGSYSYNQNSSTTMGTSSSENFNQYNAPGQYGQNQGYGSNYGNHGSYDQYSSSGNYDYSQGYGTNMFNANSGQYVGNFSNTGTQSQGQSGSSNQYGVGDNNQQHGSGQYGSSTQYGSDENKMGGNTGRYRGYDSNVQTPAFVSYPSLDQYSQYNNTGNSGSNQQSQNNSTNSNCNQGSALGSNSFTGTTGSTSTYQQGGSSVFSGSYGGTWCYPGSSGMSSQSSWNQPFNNEDKSDPVDKFKKPATGFQGGSAFDSSQTGTRFHSNNQNRDSSNKIAGQNRGSWNSRDGFTAASQENDSFNSNPTRGNFGNTQSQSQRRGGRGGFQYNNNQGRENFSNSAFNRGGYGSNNRGRGPFNNNFTSGIGERGGRGGNVPRGPFYEGFFQGESSSQAGSSRTPFFRGGPNQWRHSQENRGLSTGGGRWFNPSLGTKFSGTDGQTNKGDTKTPVYGRGTQGKSFRGALQSSKSDKPKTAIEKQAELAQKCVATLSTAASTSAENATGEKKTESGELPTDEEQSKEQAQGESKESDIDADTDKKPTEEDVEELLNTPPVEVPEYLMDQLRSLTYHEYCELCSVALDSPLRAVQHYRGKSHTKRVHNFVNTEGNMPFGKGRPMDFGPLFPDRRAGGGLWPRRRFEMEPFFPPYDFDDNDLEYCSLCAVDFSSASQAEQHYNGKNHAKKLRMSKVNAHFEHADDTNVEKKVVPVVAGPDNQTVSGPEVLVFQRGGSNIFECALCNVTVTSEDQLNTHLRGNKHQSKMKQASRGNKARRGKGRGFPFKPGGPGLMDDEDDDFFDEDRDGSFFGRGRGRRGRFGPDPFWPGDDFMPDFFDPDGPLGLLPLLPPLDFDPFFPDDDDFKHPGSKRRRRGPPEEFRPSKGKRSRRGH